MVIKRGSAAKWSSLNTILKNGQFGYEKDTKNLKIGDGVTVWNNLPYIYQSSPIAIPSAANLNNYTTALNYCCTTDAIAKTLINCPTSLAFTLRAIKHVGVRQEITECTVTNPRSFMRNCINNAWGAWYEIYHSGNLVRGYGN